MYNVEQALVSHASCFCQLISGVAKFGIQRLRIKFCWFCMCVPADSVSRTMTAAVCVSAQDLLLDLIDPEYRSQLFFDFDLTD